MLREVGQRGPHRGLGRAGREPSETGGPRSHDVVTGKTGPGAVGFQAVLLVEVDEAVGDAGGEPHRRFDGDDAVVQGHRQRSDRGAPARVLAGLRVVGWDVDRLRTVPHLDLGRFAQRPPHAFDRRVDANANDDAPHSPRYGLVVGVVGLGFGLVVGGVDGFVAGGLVVGGTVAADTGAAVVAVVGGGDAWCNEPPVRGASAPTT
jgi:hypothetical protein